MTNDESPKLLKEALNTEAMYTLAQVAKNAAPNFNEAKFLELALVNLHELSIMERMAQAADALRKCLPEDFLEVLKAIRTMAPSLPCGFVSMTLPEVIGRHGLAHLDESLDMLEWLTPFSTAEFAIRPYMEKHLDMMLNKAMVWAKHPNEHVRRLASEATRPRLPWAKRLPALAANPELTRPILVALKADESRYVQKSVANHLNDIAKEKPEWVLDLLESWPKNSDRTLWITRHAVRNLIKAGNERALNLMGAKASVDAAAKFSVDQGSIPLGQQIRLFASISSLSDEVQNIVLDYAVHFVRPNGKVSRKVFKWRAFALEARRSLKLEKWHRFVDLTTRKHIAGMHNVELILNGSTIAEINIQLLSAATDFQFKQGLNSRSQLT